MRAALRQKAVSVSSALMVPSVEEGAPMATNLMARVCMPRDKSRAQLGLAQ